MAAKEKVYPALVAASEAWAKTLHPRPTVEEACAWMYGVFSKGRHLCRATVCPSVCPRSADYGAPAPPPAWGGPPPPPMDPVDQARADQVFAGLRALRGVPEIVISRDDGPIVLSAADAELVADLLEQQPGPTPAMLALWAQVPELEVVRLDVAVDDVEEALWAEQVEGWFAAPTTTAPRPSVPVMSPSEGPPRDTTGTTAYPPCSSCGQRRTIMIVMAAGGAKPAGTLCSFCYRGAI